MLVDLASIRVAATLVVVALAVGSTSAKGAEPVRSVSIEPPKAFPATGEPSRIVAGDFNNDGRNDVAVTEQLLWNDDATTPPIATSVLVGDGTGALGPETQYLHGRSFWRSLISLDVNGDDDPDLVSTGSSGGGGGWSSVLYGSAEASFAPVASGIGLDPTEVPASLTSADLNHDAHRDLVLFEESFGIAKPYLWKADGSYAPAPEVSIGGPGSQAAIGDVNGDSNADLVIYHSGGVVVERGDGNGGFALAGNVPVPLGTQGIALGDFDADGRADLLGFGSGVYLSLSTGNSFDAPRTYLVGGPPIAAAIGDINRDGYLDAVTAGQNDGAVTVLIGDGEGAFPQRTAHPLDAGARVADVILADMNGDELPDVVAPTKDHVVVALNNTDLLAPETTMEARPSSSAPIADHFAAFRFSSPDPDAAGFVCSLDGAPATACHSPTSTPFLEDGRHTFSVAAVDASGNRDRTPALASFAVDTEAPSTTIATGPAPSVSTRRATFVFTTSEPAVTECKLDQRPWTICRSPLKIAVSRSGHVFSVRSTDSAGNVETAFPSARWEVERLSPLFKVSGVLGHANVRGLHVRLLKTLKVTGVGSARVQPRCGGCQRISGAVRVRRRGGVVRFAGLNFVMGARTKLRVIVVAPNAIARFQTFRLGRHGLSRVGSGCLDYRLRAMPCG